MSDVGHQEVEEVAVDGARLGFGNTLQQWVGSVGKDRVDAADGADFDFGVGVAGAAGQYTGSLLVEEKSFARRLLEDDGGNLCHCQEQKKRKFSEQKSQEETTNGTP